MHFNRISPGGGEARYIRKCPSFVLQEGRRLDWPGCSGGFESHHPENIRRLIMKKCPLLVQRREHKAMAIGSGDSWNTTFANCLEYGCAAYKFIKIVVSPIEERDIHIYGCAQFNTEWEVPHGE